MDEKLSKSVVANLYDLFFDEAAMTSDWYTGQGSIRFLKIITNRLDTIHANAFNRPAFYRLSMLMICIEKGAVVVRDSAFAGFDLLISIERYAKNIRHLPGDLFHPVAMSLWDIKCATWPNDINLDEMFATHPYNMLKVLEIHNVQMPQKKFRLLAATNFTAFRRLRYLELVNCGIEVIDSRAFDTIGATLEYVNLNRNWIKLIDVRMFRSVFESKGLVDFRIDHNRETLACTCRLIELEVMQCPFRDTTTDGSCFDCMRTLMPLTKMVVGVDTAAACGIYRQVHFTNFCIAKGGLVRIVTIRMTVLGDSLALRTNFISKMRMILMDLNAMQANKCDDRARARLKCFQLDKFVDRLNLMDIEEINGVEFTAITVIPILYEFGARPMHIMTVRNVAVLATIGEIELVLMAIASCALSAIIGFVAIVNLAGLGAYLSQE